VKRAWWAEARVVGVVPPSVFVPRPKVESALVELVRHDPPGDDPSRVFRLLEAGFGQRRKMLRSSLAGRVPAEAFERAGVDPTLRAESLTIEDWLRLQSQLDGP
jgi:16S rRNA (adenine1518-N6/adenine1519-N6)-dimethyltransferase